MGPISIGTIHLNSGNLPTLSIKCNIYFLLGRVNKQNATSTSQGEKLFETIMPGVVVANPTKTIQTIFKESQKSVATHRKLVNSLRTVQLTCTQQNNEDAFNTEFIKCLNRVLPIKKSEPTADRVVKFIGHFIQHVQDKSII